MASKPSPQQQFEIRRVYIKDVSFEAPNSPQVFTQQWKPETNVQLSAESARMEESLFEVALAVTVTTKMEGKTAYLVEVKQAGIFGIKGFEDRQLHQLLGSYCPNVLFPFAREAIADFVAKGGFPHLLLAPINFDALYTQQMNQQQGKSAEGGAKH